MHATARTRGGKRRVRRSGSGIYGPHQAVLLREERLPVVHDLRGDAAGRAEHGPAAVHHLRAGVSARARREGVSRDMKEIWWQ